MNVMEYEMSFVRSLRLLSVVGILLCVEIATATAPSKISYQGRLLDSNGDPVSDNNYSVTFSIYSVASGGTALWSETQSVSTASGLFATNLGLTNPLSEEYFSGPTRYLGIQIGSDPEIVPRTLLTSVPFSHRVSTLDGASGGIVTGDLLLHSTLGIGQSGDPGVLDVYDNTGQKFMTIDGSQGRIGIGISTNITAQLELDAGNQTALEIANTGIGEDYCVHAHNWQGTAAGFYSGGIGSGWPVNPTAVYGKASLPAGVGGLFSSELGDGLIAETSGDGRALWAKTSGTGYSGYFSGGSGVSIQGDLQVSGNVNSTEQVAAQRVVNSSVGASVAVTGTVDNISSGGAYGGAFYGSGTGTGPHYGLVATASGPALAAKIGVFGSAYGDGGNPTAVYGTSQIDPGGNGNAFGLDSWGSNFGTGNSTGIRGQAQGSATGDAFGGYFYAGAPAGTGNHYGIYASVTGAGTKYAGYFAGNVTVTGMLTKGAGAFRIDHPLDPENKYLQHSFVESPDMKNIYDGIVATDDSGYAAVELPDWFGALNRDYRYQLTVLGGFAQAVVVDEIRDNRFVIMTDKPHTRVSWQVTGIRQDPFANANRIQVEVDKRSEERGLFVHPDAFGKLAELGIDYNTHQPPQLASPSTGGTPK